MDPIEGGWILKGPVIDYREGLGVGELQNGKSVGPKPFTPYPPKDRIKVLAPPPRFKEWTLFASPFNMAKAPSSNVTTTLEKTVPPLPLQHG